MGGTGALKRELSLLHVFCIASGAMISSGLFILPGLAHARAGPAVILSYLVAGALAMTGAASIAEISTAMPRAGGDYFFITRSLGRGVGTVSGLLSWFSLALKSAFALVGMAAFARLVVGAEMHLAAALLCVFFTALNVVGLRHAARTQTVLVAGLFALMLLYVARGLPAMSVRNLEPFAPRGLGAVLSTAGFVFVSYGGLLKVASIAEEIKDPGRTIPRAMLLALGVVGLAYTLMVLVTTGVLPGGELDGSLTPISDGARVFLGPWGTGALGLAAVLAFITTANAGIISASRYPLALSRDGILPRLFGRIHRRFGTPHVAVLVTGAFILGALFLELTILVEAASTVLILNYLLACVAVIVLRESRVQNYRPVFRCPLYPYVQVVGILGFVLLVAEMGRDALAVTGILIALGAALYLSRRSARRRAESALLHLFERLTARDLTTRSLEAELKEIVRERDRITMDRFDHAVENCAVLDLERRTDAEQMLRQAAEELGQRIPLPAEAVHRALVQAERRSTSVVDPALAVPHIVVEGEGIFEMVIVRCREGIEFSEQNPRVTAAFVLAASTDERNTHLRALAAIAQVALSPGFQTRWLRARRAEDLRDLVLLSERRR